MRRSQSTTPDASKLDHGQVSEKALETIWPAPQNDLLYRPISPDDPEIRALAASIREHGLQEPLVITLDNVILSGHRRRVACKLAGLTHVRCWVKNITSSDPEFLPLLREYNRQRVKTVDEVFREEILSADPEESYRLLVEHRKEQSLVKAETFAIEGVKRRCKITAAKSPILEAILSLLREQREFWPLTDRRIHYGLLNDPPLIHAKKPESTYQNNHDSYRATVDIATRGRLEGLIPWEAINDPTRPVVTWDVHQEVGSFIRGELDGFLKGYYRDLQVSQPNHIEIVGEKNTIESIIRPVAIEYRIPYTLGRGYSSLDPRYKMVRRYMLSGKERLILLVLSDFDPEGEDIAHSFARSLRDDFGIQRMEPIKVALTHAQVTGMDLPPKLKAKESSSRYEKFVEKHGKNVFELEAVRPRRLQEILREVIDSILDVKAFNAEIDAEKREAARLDGIRRSLAKTLNKAAIV